MLDKGFSLIELLVSLLIISLAITILITGMTNIQNNFSKISKYFSDENSLDIEAYVYQTLNSLSDILFKKGYNTSMPELTVFNSTGVTFSYGEIRKEYFSGIEIAEIIPVKITYEDKNGRVIEVTEYIVLRGNY